MSETTKALTGGREKPKRKLPDEQVKGTEGEDLPARIEEARELNEMMTEIRRRTNADGTLLGTIKEIHIAENNPRIAVMVDLPAEDEDQRFEFDRPKIWTDRYDFVRFVEHYADYPGDIDFLVEENVDIRLMELDEDHRDDYAIVYPSESIVSKTNRSLSSRIRKNWQRYRTGQNGADEVMQNSAISVGAVGFIAGLMFIPQATEMLLLDLLLKFMASMLVGAASAIAAFLVFVVIGLVVFNWDGPPT